MFKGIRDLISYLIHGTKAANEHEVLFGPQAAGKGEHGSIVGTWVNQGVRHEIVIPLFFKGRTYAPNMTPVVIDEIWAQALMVGIVPDRIYSYGGLAIPAKAYAA